MLKSSHLAFIILGFTGPLALIGTGFSAWVFVNDGTPIKANIDAGLDIASRLEVGRLQFIAEREAREEVWPGRSYFDYSIVNDSEYNEFKTLVNQYSYRKIVFSEGNPDSTALDDGMDFLRFFHNQEMDIKTFKREPIITGLFIIPERYDESGIKFNIGIRTTNIDVSIVPEANTIDEYIQLNQKYEPKDDGSNSFFANGNWYSSFSSSNNAGLYTWKNLPNDINVIKEDGTSERYHAYEFEVNLEKMFWYEEGKKPYNRESVEKLKNSIEEAKDQGEEVVSQKRRIQFEFASTLTY